MMRVASGLLVTRRDSPNKMKTHLKRKCKTQRETEFFLQNSVSFFHPKSLLHDFLC